MLLCGQQRRFKCCHCRMRHRCCSCSCSCCCCCRRRRRCCFCGTAAAAAAAAAAGHATGASCCSCWFNTIISCGCGCLSCMCHMSHDGGWWGECQCGLRGFTGTKCKKQENISRKLVPLHKHRCISFCHFCAALLVLALCGLWPMFNHKTVTCQCVTCQSGVPSRIVVLLLQQESKAAASTLIQHEAASAAAAAALQH